MTQPSLTIRSCREKDLSAVIELLAQLSLGTQREAASLDYFDQYRLAFQDIQADSRQTLLVAETGGKIVGTICFIVVPSLAYRGAPYAIVESMVVDTAARGKRYGEQLIQHTIQMAREAGCRSLKLTSNKIRHDAHRFYQREGFVADHEGFTLELKPIS